MNEHEQWLQNNKDYLRDAIHWVHLRLEQQIESLAPVKTTAPTKKCWFKRRKTKSSPESDQSAKTAVLALAAEKMAAAEAANPARASGMVSLSAEIRVIITTVSAW